MLRLHEQRLHVLKVVQLNESKDVPTTQNKSALISSPATHRPYTGGVKVPALFRGEFHMARGPHKLSMHLVNIDSSVEDLMSKAGRSTC